jgi:hypothetical protein
VSGTSGGLERARGHLAVAVAELDAACRAWGVWADDVREQAEMRLGADPEDLRVLRDAEYARALDAGAPFLEAARVAMAAVAASRGGLAGPGRAGPETAIGSPRS